MAPPPQVMTLALDKLTRRFPCLCQQLGLLITNPFQLGNGVGTCDLQSGAGGRHQRDAPTWRMHRQVHVLHCFARDCNLDVAARGTGNTPKERHNLSRSYRRLAQRLDGLAWSSLYDLRHFFASQLAKQGANEQQIGRLLRHVGQSVTSSLSGTS